MIEEELATKPYDWEGGAALQNHSKRKHKILREYFQKYLGVRCQIPHQSKFRLAVIDGFAGGGRYACGSVGSPLIFIEELRAAVERSNLYRVANNLPNLEIECLLVLSDQNQAAINLLKANCAPLVAAAKDECPALHLLTHFYVGEFERLYPSIKELVVRGRYRSVLYNLDQCGHSQVRRGTLVDIMRSLASAEIFLTFAIETLLAFLAKTEPERAKAQLRHLDVSPNDLQGIEKIISDDAWLGAAERLVFDVFGKCAPFVSTFSINNPAGWRYWLIHFANNYRARQVYNNTLHDNATSQAHFGRSGLEMLSYDPRHDGEKYLFDLGGRASAKVQLLDDIPRLVSDAGDAINVGEFYEAAYSATPAHSDDIHSAIIEAADLEVLTANGGIRRSANTIEPSDTLRLKRQRSFFPMFLGPSSKA
ncbi:MAG TPA: three-Cys-motif partner protein TcmP [Terricaulis sp.]|nr:three-Cys-motif partner protein TcmP [Terricaulis sp.]